MAATNKTPEIGQFVESKGIYAGVWEPKDRDGKSLGKIFDLYAAPEDLIERGKKLLLTFNKAVKYVASLHNYYHGYNGFNHDVRDLKPDEVLYYAIRKGDYNGEWFIPPKGVLNDNLHGNKDEFSSQNGFPTKYNGSILGLWYWSCTEACTEEIRHPSPGSPMIWMQRFPDGNDLSDLKDNLAVSTRLVRAELRPSST